MKFPQRQTGLSTKKEKKIYFQAELEKSAEGNTVLKMVSAKCEVGISRSNRTVHCKNTGGLVLVIAATKGYKTPLNNYTIYPPLRPNRFCTHSLTLRIL
jgi:hypothetical protein